VAKVEEFLVEAADLQAAIDQVDFQDPVAAASGPVQPTHRVIASGGDVGLDVVAGDLLVRELADQVPGNLTAELPARLLGEFGYLCVELRAGDVRMRFEESPAPGRRALAGRRAAGA
jgi:hypothetical protein